MGSWSVYCGLSKITIKSGDECVLLPLKKNDAYRSYLPYLPATLPIYGTYNDYGGLEDIVENDNTKLIEEYFGCTIDKFVGYFTEEKNYQRGDVQPEDFNDRFDEMKDWNFMFIHKEVYDFLSSKIYDNDTHIEMGNPAILNLLGFEYVGKTNEDRYCHEWKYEDKTFYSDGTWLNVDSKGKQGIYRISNLTTYVNIPEDKHYLFNCNSFELWKYYREDEQRKMFYWIIGGKEYNYSFDISDELLEYIKKSKVKTNSIQDLYLNNISVFGDELAKLVICKYNMNSYSQTFEPYICYQTPQYGEYKAHDIILRKFVDINKESFYNEDDK